MLALCLTLGAQAAEPSLAYNVQPGDKLTVRVTRNEPEIEVHEGPPAATRGEHGSNSADPARPGRAASAPGRAQ